MCQNIHFEKNILITLLLISNEILKKKILRKIIINIKHYKYVNHAQRCE